MITFIEPFLVKPFRFLNILAGAVQLQQVLAIEECISALLLAASSIVGQFLGDLPFIACILGLDLGSCRIVVLKNTAGPSEAFALGSVDALRTLLRNLGSLGHHGHRWQQLAVGHRGERSPCLGQVESL